MHKNNENLSPEINAKLKESELLGGVWLEPPTGSAVVGQPFLPTKRKLLITTLSRVYTLCKLEDGTYTLQGHPECCPQARPFQPHGSTWGGSMLKMSWVGRGMRLEGHFTDGLEPRNILLSSCKEIKEEEL